MKESLDVFVTLLDAFSEILPKELELAVRPVRGCVWRLENNLGNTSAIHDALDILDGLAQQVHMACQGIVDRDLAKQVNIALYAFEGTVVELKSRVTKM